MDIYTYDGNNIQTYSDDKLIDNIQLAVDLEDFYNNSFMYPLTNGGYIFSYNIENDMERYSSIGRLNKGIIKTEQVYITQPPIVDNRFVSADNYVEIKDDNFIISDLSNRASMIEMPANIKSNMNTQEQIEKLLFVNPDIADYLNIVEYKNKQYAIKSGNIVAWFDEKYIIVEADLDDSCIFVIYDLSLPYQKDHILDDIMDTKYNLPYVVSIINFELEFDINEIYDKYVNTNPDTSIDIFLTIINEVIILHITHDREIELETYNLKEILNLKDEYDFHNISGDEYGFVVRNASRDWYYIDRYTRKSKYLGNYYYIIFTHERYRKQRKTCILDSFDDIHINLRKIIAEYD